jgi:hypothetical protein
MYIFAAQASKFVFAAQASKFVFAAQASKFVYLILNKFITNFIFLKKIGG